MPNKEKFLAAVVIVALLAGEFFSFFYFKKYELFYHERSDDEVNHGIFSRLDPILGYAHNLNYKLTPRDLQEGFFKDVQKTNLSVPGFVILENRTDDHPLRIAILGDSLSDPFLFNGNWPWQLHLLLKEKNISHVIYNGAVSGYVGYQQFNKLVRDVLNLEKMDLILLYSGFTEFKILGDTVPEHPAVQVYQKYVYDKFAGNVNFSKDPSFLPNLQFLMTEIYSRFLRGHENTLSLGIPVKDESENFKKLITYMHALASLNGSKLIYFMPPVVQHYEQFDDANYFESRDVREKVAVEEFRKDVLHMKDVLKDVSFGHSLYGLFPEKDQKYFLDPSHLNTTGNKIVAEEIYKVISANLSPKR